MGGGKALVAGPLEKELFCGFTNVTYEELVMSFHLPSYRCTGPLATAPPLPGSAQGSRRARRLTTILAVKGCQNPVLRSEPSFNLSSEGVVVGSELFSLFIWYTKYLTGRFGIYF